VFGDPFGRVAGQVALNGLFQSDFLGVADHDSSLRHLDFAGDGGVDQAGFVFFEGGDLVLFDE
jgi:hypothetical protein